MNHHLKDIKKIIDDSIFLMLYYYLKSTNLFNRILKKLKNKYNNKKDGFIDIKFIPSIFF